MNILDLSTLLRPGTLTKLSLGMTRFLSTKTSEEETLVRSIKTLIREGEMLRQSYKKKKKKKVYKRTKILVKGPNPRVPHLVFLPELGSEGRHATPRR